MGRGRIALLILLLALALVGISVHGGPVTYVFLWLVILIPLSCLIYIWLVILSIKIYQRSDGRGMTASVPSDFYITINNEGLFSFSSVRLIFYSSFSTVMGLDDRTVYELPPHTSITRRTQLLCRYRGEYLVGIKQIEVRDYLGLFKITYTIKEPLSVVVSPAMIELEALKSEEDAADSDRDSLSDRTEPDTVVREYVPGDDTRLIHHKASAVMQKPMIRQLTGGEKNGVLLVMESERTGKHPEEYLPTENRIIESFLALSLYYIRNNIPVDAVYKSTAIRHEYLRGIGDYERLYESMRTYSFGDEGSTLQLLDELLGEAGSFSPREIVFIFDSVDEERLDLIRRINVLRVKTRVYIVGEEPGEGGAAFDDVATLVRIGVKIPTEDVL